MTNIVLIGTAFVIIQEMLHERISLSSVLLLLPVNFVSWFNLALMYISLIVSIRSSLTHLHGFQLLILLSYFIEITFFVCTNRINLNLKESSGRLVIIAKGFLKLLKLHMLRKQKCLSLPSRDFWQIANSNLNKAKSATPQFNRYVLSSAL